MIVALLVLIVAILLFGAGVVRGFLANAFGLILGGIVVLFAIGFVANRYKASQTQAEHASLVAEAKPMILNGVAAKLGKPTASLVNTTWYDTEGDLYGCGSVAGTSGYGGNSGQQRFLSNGGNIEIERPSDKANFDERMDLHCTFDPSVVTMRDR